MKKSSKCYIWYGTYYYDCTEILFIYSMISMKIIFHFNIKNFKNKHFHIYLNKIYKIAFACKKCSILQNGLQVDEILNFFYFQDNET